jgi:hypothetical protein
MGVEVLDPPDIAMPVNNVSLSPDNSAHQIADFLDSLSDYPGGHEGVGIVIPGGAGRFAACTWVCARLLRHLGCQLPIQVWHLGKSESDRTLFSMLSSLQVECVDAESVQGIHPHSHLRGWELKPYAILHCPFREVLLLDADNGPVRDPSFLFGTDEYQRTGAIFWPDYWMMDEQRSFWKVMGISYRKEPEFESGQILIDKSRCWHALQLTNWLCERGTGFFWHHCHGDKDCFRAAWHRTATPFAMPKLGVTTLSDYVMCQYDFDGARLFQHRNMDKWSLKVNVRVPDCHHEDACFSFIEELRVNLASDRREEV